MVYGLWYKVVRQDAFLDHHCRVAGNNGPWFDVIHHYGPGADNRTVAHCDAWTDKGIGADPRLGTNVDRILRGAGRAFVAGADVTEFAGSSARRIEEVALSVLRLFVEIENLKIPVIAVLDGFTLGGGNELAMSAHYRIATENAVIGQPEIKLGIFPGYGGMQRLPRLVGPRKAAE